MRVRYVFSDERARYSLFLLCALVCSITSGDPKTDICASSNLALLKQGLYRVDPKLPRYNRGAHDYATTLGKRFQDLYRTLPADAVIVDLGDGYGRFGREMTTNYWWGKPAGFAEVDPGRAMYPRVAEEFKASIAFIDQTIAISPKKRPRVVGITYDDKDPHKVRANSGRYEQVRGHFETLPPKLLPQGTTGVELWGIFAYSDQLDVSARRAFSMFPKDSALFLEMDRSDNDQFARTQVQLPNGKVISGINWLKLRSRGLAVETYVTHGFDRDHTIAHIKITGDVWLPDLVLDPVRSNFNQRPPDRYFIERATPNK